MSTVKEPEVNWNQEMMVEVQLGEPDDSGRRRPKVKEGSEFEIKVDMVIKALGFDTEDLPYLFD